MAQLIGMSASHRSSSGQLGVGPEHTCWRSPKAFDCQRGRDEASSTSLFGNMAGLAMVLSCPWEEALAAARQEVSGLMRKQVLLLCL